MVNGLKSEEAKKLLEKFGYNEIKDINKKTLIKILLHQIKNNFIIYLLFFAMLFSFIASKNLTGYVILAVILIVITTGFFQEYKAEKAIESLKEMLVPISIVIRDGKEKEVPSKEIVPGDILVLRSGEKIPADCLILEQKNLLVNESILTGESREIRKKETKDEKDYTDENLLFTGTLIIEGKCIAKVLHTGMNTRFGKIASMISTTEKELPLQKKLNKIAKYLTIYGVTFSILTGLLILLRANLITQETIINTLIVVIAVMVSSFPEGFPVVLITALSTGVYRMAKKNAIVNRMSVIETLGETTVICTDKTGTLTKGEMTIKKILTDGRIYEVTGEGYEGNGDFYLNGKKINPKKENVLNLLLKSAVLCNDAIIERTGEDKIFNSIGNPTEISLLVLSSKADIYKEDFIFKREEEIPFNSTRKMMSTLYKEGKDFFVYTKGAPEIILKKCKYIQRENGFWRLTEKEKEKILKINEKFNKEAYRTLALAYKKENSKNIKEEDLIFIGIVAIEDPPKKEVPEAIKICLNSGIKVKMVTGDHKETALAIAKQIGLKGKIIEGEELEKLTDEELSKIIEEITIFARVKPEHKLKIVKALKMKGEIVTMTGDGINDAPALKEAHIGVAMGKKGTDVTKEVADLTLKDDNFATIVEAIKEGRTIFTNIQKFTTYQTSINFSQVALIFLSILLKLPSPLVAIQILFMNLFTDELTAITLAFNPYSKDAMEQKPRKKSEIITKPLLLMLVLAGLTITLFSLAVYSYFYQRESFKIASTITFTTMVLFGITNAFNFRSFRKRTLNRSPFTNKPLLFVSIIAILSLLATIYSPLLNKLLETTPIRFSYFLISFLISFSIILIFDFIKYLNEKKHFWTEDMQYFLKTNHKAEHQ